MNPTAMRGRIIIVEDEPLISIAIEQAVLEAGCEVAGFAHGVAEAFALLDEVQFHGVVLDANLCGESAEPIAAHLKSTNSPYILVTGYARDQLGFADECVPLVRKPFACNELIAAIRRHLILLKE